MTTKLRVIKLSSKNKNYMKVSLSQGIIGAKIGWTWVNADLKVNEEVDIPSELYDKCEIVPIELADGKVAKTLSF